MEDATAPNGASPPGVAKPFVVRHVEELWDGQAWKVWLNRGRLVRRLLAERYDFLSAKTLDLLMDDVEFWTTCHESVFLAEQRRLGVLSVHPDKEQQE